MDARLRQWRADTPGCNVRVHLNNAGAALMPTPVLRATIAHLELEANLGGYEAADACMAQIEQCYENIAAC